MKKLIALIVCMILCSIVIPLFLDYFIWANNVSSSISNSDWSGFLGSFLGGIIGGCGTLIAVYFTTLETRRIQNESKEQNLNERIKNFIKEKYWHFSEQIATYYTDLAIIEHQFNKLLLEYKKHDQQKKELERIEWDLKKICKSENERQTQILERNKDIKESWIAKSDIKIEDLKNSIILKRNNLKYSYLFLKIIISDITDSNDFLKLVKELESILDRLCEELENANEVETIYKQLIDKKDSLEKEGRLLIKEYEKKSI